MNWNDYVEQSSRTCAELPTPLLNDIHMVLGMGTEVSEIQDVIKKNMAYNKPIDYINVQEEIGDLCWYVANFCRMNNFDLEKILENNIKKLYARYPNKFNSEDAVIRNLEKERAILEELGK